MKRRWVQTFRDRYGVTRWYFRRPGYPRVPLPNPASAEFANAYMTALAGAKVPIGITRSGPGTMRALAISYFQSAAFHRLSRNTAKPYRSVIERLCTDYGSHRVGTLQAAHVRKLMLQRSTPDSSNLLLRAMRALMKHAVDVGMRSDDPTAGVRKVKIKRDGYHTWTEDEIEKFEFTHPIGSRARLAFALLLYTGQRRGDIVRLGRQHIRDGLISLRQQKTGTEVTIPVHPNLAAILAGSEITGLAIISSESRTGHPIGPEQFGHWFRQMCNQAELPHCSAHGLRKAAARRLAEAGATAHEIAAITGHKTLAEVQRYSEAADRVRLARSAMDKLGTSWLSNSKVFTEEGRK